MSEVDPTVRELRRRVSRQIIGLHEILDAVLGARMENWDGFLRDWDDATAGIEDDGIGDQKWRTQMVVGWDSEKSPGFAVVIIWS
ncbi:hypothetical protein RJ640_007804 [Escallonia rubra]|uniref:Uncharacterized protein n=1 Tax=Escallonia rubra TaxID=112253 RepID=A0AA88QY98_9ASTE|nr:hypothetical protein RJ640_007804 [Escallonia rubra]